MSATLRLPARISFTVTILTAFALVVLAAIGAVVVGYRLAGAEAAYATAERSLARAAETAAASTRALIRPVVALSTVLPEFAPLALRADPAARDTAALLTLLTSEPAVQVISMGLPDGTLRQVLRARELRGPDAPKVPAGAEFALREVAPDAPLEDWTFLDAGLRSLAALQQSRTVGDPRQAQWFLQAQDGSVHVTTLYDLPLLGRPGLSLSRRVPGSSAVFALDMTLDSLAAFLGRLRASPHSTLFLFTEDGILLAHQRPELAAIPVGGERTRWTTLAASGDALLQAIWDEYAQGRLIPERNRELGALLVRLVPVDDLAAPHVLVAVAAPVTDFTAPVDAAVRDGTGRAALALLAGLGAIWLLAWRMAKPLGALTREAEAIRRLNFEGAVPVRSRITEIARLSGSMDQMKSALRLFGVYVPRDLVGKLMREGYAARVGGERRPLTVMFSDVQGFTTLAEAIAPEELMRITSSYFQAVTEELMQHRATIDKFIGDAVMAIWNAPQDDAAHARHACLAALWTRQLTERLCEEFPARGWPPLRTRFGLHTGEAVVGNVGSTDRLSYTAIGSMVNIASRLEGMNKLYGSRILISEATRRAAGPGLVTRPVDLVVAKGSHMPLEVHELLGLSMLDRPEDVPLLLPQARSVRLAAWEAMVRHYRAGEFDAAEATLTACGTPGEDPVLALYAGRIRALRADPPDAGWSPVLYLATK